MSSRTSQRTVYLVTAAIVASMVGGFALADMTLGGGTNTSYQGSQTTTVSPMPGLTWLYTNVSVVAGTTGSSLPNTCTVLLTACDVSSTGITACVGSFSGSACSAGDFAENVTLSVNITIAFPGTVALTMYVTGTPFGASVPGTFTGPTSYFAESTGHPSVAENIVLVFDIGTISHGPGAVTSVSVIATT